MLSIKPLPLPALLLAALSILLLLSSGKLSASETWAIKKSKNGVDVYTRPVPGSSVQEFKGEMSIESSISAVVALLDDTDAAPEWIYNCRSMTLLKSDGKKKWNYVVNALPWPATDRDVVVYSEMAQDPESLAVEITLSAQPEMHPLQDKLVRIKHMVASWRISPEPEQGKVKVTYQAHVEPGGELPSWLINALLVDSPFESLTAMKKVVKQNKYQQQQRDDVVEPLG